MFKKKRKQNETEVLELTGVVILFAALTVSVPFPKAFLSAEL